jgi:ABC-type glycerol-3-phosphate transport system substrate-binding protein
MQVYLAYVCNFLLASWLRGQWPGKPQQDQHNAPEGGTEMMMKRTFLAGAALVAMSVTALAAGCGIEKGSVRVLSNDFPALHAVVGEAEKCATEAVKVTKNQTKDHESLAVAALTANPAEYTSAIVANSSILPLINGGLVRPLDDLVAKHGSGLLKTQLITIDGKVMAVAFMANAQHFFYRADILEKAGVAVPKTYEDVLAAAKVIKEKGLMANPVGGTYKAGWNLGEEFVNMYLGMGGEFFEPGSAKASINNEKGVAALTMMKSLSEHMNPDFLTFDSNALQAEFEAGKVAMATLWGSRAGAVTDAEGSTPEIAGAIKFAAAPMVGGGNIPATTLWWDGFAIAKNISDEDAEATFRAMIHGTSTAMANANGDKAVWLIAGFTPGATAAGVSESAAAGAKPYPMTPFVGLLHDALGAEIVEFMQGKEDAAKALADTEAAYSAAAKEKGFLK